MAVYVLKVVHVLFVWLHVPTQYQEWLYLLLFIDNLIFKIRLFNIYFLICQPYVVLALCPTHKICAEYPNDECELIQPDHPNEIKPAWDLVKSNVSIFFSKGK